MCACDDTDGSSRLGEACGGICICCTRPRPFLTIPFHRFIQVEALGETVVAKFFPEEDGFPFHEVCGNVVGTSLLGQVR